MRTGVFLAMIALAFGVDFQIGGIGPAIAIVAVLLPFVWGLGAASAAAVVAFPHAAGLIGLGGYALGVLSGAYFPLHLLPPWAQTLSQRNPIALALTGLREALLGGAGWEPALPRIAILAPISLIAWAAGLALFRLAQAREFRAGTLGLY